MRTATLLLLLAAMGTLCPAQKRLVLIDEDGSGPGGSNQMAMLALLQAPQAQVLGITMVTGNAWRDEETLHTLRMMELTGHADIPVAMGAVFPLVRTEQETRLSAALDGKADWLGAVPPCCWKRPQAWPRPLRKNSSHTGRTRFRPCRKAGPRSSPSTRTRSTFSFARCARIRTR